MYLSAWSCDEGTHCTFTCMWYLRHQSQKSLIPRLSLGSIFSFASSKKPLCCPPLVELPPLGGQNFWQRPLQLLTPLLLCVKPLFPSSTPVLCVRGSSGLILPTWCLNCLDVNDWLDTAPSVVFLSKPLRGPKVWWAPFRAALATTYFDPNHGCNVVLQKLTWGL